MMEAFIKEIGSMIFKTVMVKRSFLTKQSLLDSTKLARNMVRVEWNGLMDQCMRENSEMANFMVKEHIFGLTTDVTLVNGLMAKWRELGR